MALFYQHNINENTRLGIWKIEEDENFFLSFVPLQRDITHPHKRLQHLAGRYLLRYLFPDFPYEEILIADTKKPYLPYEQYHFSISHSGKYAAALVSKSSRVGIDIEMPAEKLEKISHKFLNKEERKQFNIIEHDNQYSNNNYAERVANYRLLSILWSAKEAVYKWWGWGNVNFSEHILLYPFSFDTTGNFDAKFFREAQQYSLKLAYQLFDEICLVWVASVV